MNALNALDHSLPYRRLLAPALMLAGLMAAAACSRQQPPPPAAHAPATPRVAADATSGDGKADDVLTSTTTAGGIPATYRAIFANDQLERIVETRDSSAAPPRAQSGDYEFYGARLTKYAGAAPGTGAAVELEFDLHGAVSAARSEAGGVPQDVISAIRTRAQLLRSHALAQRAVRAHAR